MEKDCQSKLLLKLEEISKEWPNRIIRLKGIITRQGRISEPLEVLIFRGFTSCTTHPTINNPNQSTIPKGSTFIEGEILEGPMIPSKETVLFSKLKPSQLLETVFWKE